MDYDPPDHFQMPSPIIKLKSSDGEIFQVEVKMVQLFLHIKEMLDDLGLEGTEVISIPQNAPEISGAILGKIIHWASHHKDDPAVADDDEKKQVKPTDDISSWDAEFIQVDQITLFQMIRAANYLNIKGLLDLTCKTVAKIINGQTLEEVRLRFDIKNDFSPDEMEQVRNEGKWYEHEGIDSEGNHYRSVNGYGMDQTPADFVQDVDNEGRAVIEECLSNSVIIRKMFQYFSDIKLQQLSYLNKVWNYEARSFLRKRGNLFACINYSHHVPCEENVRAFLSATEKMNIVPFTGISFGFNGCHHGRACPGKALDPKIILARLPLKKVSLVAHDLYDKFDACAGFLLIKQVLQVFSRVLEELSLSVYAHKKGFIEKVVQEFTFPRLTVLKLMEDYHEPHGAYIDNIKEMVSRAPRLQELHSDQPIKVVVDALKGTSVVIVYTRWVRAPFDEISEDAIIALRLQQMKLFHTGAQFNFERFHRITPALLQASCTTTLRSMMVDAVLAVPLMCYGICLENVTHLEMHMNPEKLQKLEPRLLRIVKDFDFTRILPNLQKVKICGDYSTRLVRDHIHRIIEMANAVLKDPTSDRAANIKELHLYKCNLSNSTAQFFAEMFPTLEKLEVKAEAHEQIPFGSIWNHWADLKEIQVQGNLTAYAGNLDCVFCGIFLEEVAELREKDEEYLKRVNIVPVMPALTCLKNLRTLTLYHGNYYGAFADGASFMFSKVAALIAFARCPALGVSLQITSREVPPSMPHLKPYMTIKCVSC